MKKLTALLCLMLTAICVGCKQHKATFEVKDHAFLIDGKPFQFICGEMHYPRIPQEYWRDRMKRAKAMGINTLSTYVFWNFHERRPGEFNFEGQADLAKFIKIAQEEGLFVVLRPGPYVCAEWDFGGYPYWLQKDTSMVYRSKDKAFMAACKRYINRLGEELSDLTLPNGGPIVMVQVENEYGSYGSDKEYLAQLRDMIKEAGFNVPLITCDGSGQMGGGHVEGALPAVNGAAGEDIMRAVDKYLPGGPYFVAEFYPAWFDVWGKPHSLRDNQKKIEQFDWMLEHGVSVSIYMFHGGTNFWYTNGANNSYGYEPQPTSYDYDAPLGEYGNITPKYLAFREIVQRHRPNGVELPDVPAENPVTSFPEVTLSQSAPLSAAFTKRVSSEHPLTMEDVDQDFGYIHYETTLKDTVRNAVLRVRDVRDYAVVLLNGKRIGSLDRRNRQDRLKIDVMEVPAKLEILVENVGRINYGWDIKNNRKGITEKILLNGEELKGWTVTPLPLYCADVSELAWQDKDISGQPAFYRGTFKVDKIGDTFLDTRGWGKGAAWVNGHSLGKFWYVGPQQTLYVPGPWLKKGENEIVIFEMEDQGHRKVAGLDKPILDQVNEDKNVGELHDKYPDKTPVLDRGDIIFSGELKKEADWQSFTFDGGRTLRHLCFESLSSYDGKHSCIGEIELIDADGKPISKDKWQVVYANTEEPKEGPAELMIDDDTKSYWHSQWRHAPLTPFPHRVIIDLGDIYNVTGIRIRLRSPKSAGCVERFRLYGRPQFFLFK